MSAAALRTFPAGKRVCGVSVPRGVTRRRRQVIKLHSGRSNPIAALAHYMGVGKIVSTFDSGADCTTIDAKFVRDFPDVGDAHSNRWWELADGKVTKEVKRVCLNVTIEGFTYSVSPVIVLERCPSGVLLGRNFMKGAGVKVGYSPTGVTEIDMCGIPIKPVENEWWMRGGPPALGAVCSVQQSVAQHCCRLVQVRVAQKSGDVILAGHQSKDDT